MTSKTWKEFAKEALTEDIKSTEEQFAYDEELNQEMFDEAIEQAWTFYSTLNSEEKERWESSIRPIYESEKISKSLFADHLSKRVNKIAELETYFNISGLNKDSLIKELESERREYIKKLSKYELGRELINNYEPEVFLCLFDTRTNLHVFSLNGQCITNGIKFHQVREEIEDLFANYKAIDEMINSLSKTLKKQPDKEKSITLKDLLIDSIKYNDILNSLIYFDVIDLDSKKFIEKKSNYLELPGLLEFLCEKRQLNVNKISQSLAEIVLLNTFEFKVTQYNFTNRSLSPKLEESLHRCLNIK